MLTKKQRQERGRRAGIASALSMTRAQRVERSRKANAARWGKNAGLADALTKNIDKHTTPSHARGTATASAVLRVELPLDGAAKEMRMDTRMIEQHDREAVNVSGSPAR